MATSCSKVSEGAGEQWGPLVIDAYFRCRDRLVVIRQRGLGESLRDAMDGAIRNWMGQDELASAEMSIINQACRGRPPTANESANPIRLCGLARGSDRSHRGLL
jgi:hypothetical protein